MVTIATPEQIAEWAKRRLAREVNSSTRSILEAYSDVAFVRRRAESEATAKTDGTKRHRRKHQVREATEPPVMLKVFS